MSTRRIWHEETDLSGFDAIVLPGGFSYGDYLRCGAIARFAPALQSLMDFAAKGGRVHGICNGFQELTELGLLPGALTRNRDLHFICEDALLKVESQRTAWMEGYSGGTLTLPIAHGEGRYQCSDDTLKQLQDDDAIALSYGDNPNGSVNDIAGITNASGTVLGLMPHLNGPVIRPRRNRWPSDAGGAAGLMPTRRTLLLSGASTVITALVSRP